MPTRDAIIRVSGDYTAQPTESGATFVVLSPGVVTLPAMADGLRYRLIDVTGSDPATPCKVRPQPSDRFVNRRVSASPGVALQSAQGPGMGALTIEVVGTVGVGWLVNGVDWWPES